MRNQEGVFCPRCLEYLGDAENLIECPVCLYEFKNKQYVIPEDND